MSLRPLSGRSAEDEAESPVIGAETTLIGTVKRSRNGVPVVVVVGGHTYNVNETMVCLNNSQLTSLPEGVGFMSALGRLYLDDNQLTNLPSSFGKLTGLSIFLCDDNDLTCPPLAVCKQGVGAIRDWFAELPRHVQANRTLYGDPIKARLEGDEFKDRLLLKLSIFARLGDEEKTPIGARIDLSTLAPDTLKRMGFFAGMKRHNKGALVEVDDSFHLVYNWMLSSPAFKPPTGMYSKALTDQLLLEIWLDEVDKTFIKDLTEEALWRVVTYAERNTIQPFLDLVATRLVTEWWGRC